MNLAKTLPMCFLLACCSSANAMLIERLGGLAYYDTDSKLTWLADANYAHTIGHESGGSMSWEEANAWAAEVEIAGVTGWRLPEVRQPDPSCSDQLDGGISFGYYCTGSEMSNLIYNVLGGNPDVPITESHNSNYDLFTNILPYFYWSSTEYSVDTGAAWGMALDRNSQLVALKWSSSRVWLVKSGNVPAAPLLATVPLPPAVWLFGAGLLSLFLATNNSLKTKAKGYFS